MQVTYEVAKGTKRSAFDKKLDGFEEHFERFKIELDKRTLATRLIHDLGSLTTLDVVYLGMGSFGVAYGVLGLMRYAVKILTTVTEDSEALIGTWFNPARWKDGIKIGTPVPSRREGLALFGKKDDLLLNVLDYRAVGKLTFEDAKKLVALFLKRFENVAKAESGLEALEEMMNELSLESTATDATVGFVFELEMAEGTVVDFISKTDDALVLAENVRSMLFQILMTLRRLNDFSGFVHGDLTLNNVFYLPYETVGQSRPALIYRRKTTDYRIEADADTKKLIVFMLADFGFSSLSNKDALDAKLKNTTDRDFDAFAKGNVSFLRNHGADLHLLGVSTVAWLSSVLLVEPNGLKNLNEANALLVEIFKFCVERLFYSWSSLKNESFSPIGGETEYEVNFNSTIGLLADLSRDAKTAEEMARIFSMSYNQIANPKNPKKEPPFDVNIPVMDVHYLPVEAYESVSKNVRYEFWSDPLFKSYEVPKKKKKKTLKKPLETLPIKKSKIGPGKKLPSIFTDPNTPFQTIFSTPSLTW